MVALATSDLSAAVFSDILYDWVDVSQQQFKFNWYMLEILFMRTKLWLQMLTVDISAELVIASINVISHTASLVGTSGKTLHTRYYMFTSEVINYWMLSCLDQWIPYNDMEPTGFLHQMIFVLLRALLHLWD